MAQIVKLITKNNVSQAMQMAIMLQKRWESNPDAADVELVVREPKRSLKQNSLLHAIFQQCADKTPHKWVRSTLTDILFRRLGSPGFWKDELKSKLGKKEVHFDLEDNPTVIMVSTSDYTKPEMADFVTKIQAHMKQVYDVDIEIKEIMEELK